jgi:hypothetical protein
MVELGVVRTSIFLRSSPVCHGRASLRRVGHGAV